MESIGVAIRGTDGLEGSAGSCCREALTEFEFEFGVGSQWMSYLECVAIVVEEYNAGTRSSGCVVTARS